MNIYRLQTFYRKLKNRPLRIALLKTAQFLRMRTLIVRMDINNFCNLRCIMCPAAERDPATTSKKVMLLDDFRKIAADIFPRTRCLYLSCGFEPLVVKYFDRCLVISKEHNIPFVSFATNGMLLDDHICRTMIESQIDEIIVSADGANPSTFESIRRGASFSGLKDNIELLQDMKKDARSKKPVLRINYTLMDTNISEIPKFIEAFAGLGMKILELRPLRMDGVDAEGRTLFTKHGTDAYNRVIRDVQQICKAKDIRLIALSSIEEPDQGHRKTSNSIDKKSKINLCILPWIAFAINVYGEMTACLSGYRAGNLLEKNYDEIMGSAAMREFLKTTRTDNSFCRDCPLREELIA